MIHPLSSTAILVLQSTVYVGVSSRGWLAWIFIGLVAGWLAGQLTRGRGFGCVVNVILGLIGAVIGGWVFSTLGAVVLGFWGSLAAATIGAILLVAIARIFAGSGPER